MKVPQVFLFLLAFVTTINALAVPSYFESTIESSKELFKRKGGGGGGGRGGGGGGSRSSGSSSSGSKSGSSGSSAGSSRTSNVGGTSSRGSGNPPAYGGAGGSRYYGGGAAVPYRAGATSRGVSPALVGGGAALFLFPALAYGAYSYGYPGSYRYYNETSRTNESHPMNCYCGRYQACGCEGNNNTDYLNSIARNSSVAKLVNNTLQIDGSLENGTTAAGGEGAASSLQQGLYEMSGLWVVLAGVTYTMWLM